MTHSAPWPVKRQLKTRGAVIILTNAYTTPPLMPLITNTGSIRHQRYFVCGTHECTWRQAAMRCVSCDFHQCVHGCDDAEGGENAPRCRDQQLRRATDLNQCVGWTCTTQHIQYKLVCPTVEIARKNDTILHVHAAKMAGVTNNVTGDGTCK